MVNEKILSWAIILLFGLILFFSSAILTTRLILRGEFVTVPDLRNKTPEEARFELNQRFLSLRLQSTEYHDEIEKGRIIRQEPPAGSKIRTNRTVSVVISAGSELVEIPDLTNKSLERAVQILASSGLARGVIAQIHTPQYPAGRVIAQQPKPGVGRVKRMTPVSLLISQGEREPKFIMPDLIGHKADLIIVQLKNLGFNVANIRSSYYPGLKSGIIIKQSPPHGYPVQKRSLITLEVSR
ncbi:MAG: PASTA domain-containing protein [Candidatus Aminicenantes bacterium]|nr:PASTA domain-containing protein [Candidatus Aminicenantes bacterium]